MTAQSITFIILIIFFIFLAGCSQPATNENALPGKKIADELSSQIRTIGPIDDSIFEDYSKYQDGIKKVNQLTRIINDKIKTEIPEVGSTISDFEKFKEIKIVLQYTPLVEPYNQLYQSSLKLPSENKTDYNSFYTDIGIFSLEVCIIESKMSYKIAYKTTGELASNFKLYQLSPYIGDEGYKVLLSEIHWSIREQIDNQTKVLSNFLINIT
jgi:hypothetical protein